MMTCISEILKLKGNKEFLMINLDGVAEDGGIYKGYEYLVTFNDMGFRCGYVSINKENKVYDLCLYDDLPDFNVHGGVTFFDTSDCILDESLIKNSCADKWIGFDAYHYGDKSDINLAIKLFSNSNDYLLKNISIYGEIRSKEYMVEQCKELIDQLVELNSEKVGFPMSKKFMDENLLGIVQDNFKLCEHGILFKYNICNKCNKKDDK